MNLATLTGVQETSSPRKRLGLPLRSVSDAALSALILGVIGRSAAATKYTVLAALGNIGELYMTVTSGWIHDRWSTEMMLIAEAVAALVCIEVAGLVLKQFGETAQHQKSQVASRS